MKKNIPDPDQYNIIKHPVLYSVFKPKELIKADRQELNNVSELNLYNFILNDNHAKDPGKLIYNVPSEVIFSDTTQLARNKVNFMKNIQQRSIYMDREFMNKFIGENKDGSFVPFPTVHFRPSDKIFEVEIHPYLKRLLADAHKLGFVKGDYEHVKTLNKKLNTLYWYFRALQVQKRVHQKTVDQMRNEMKLNGYKDWSNFKKNFLDPGVEEFRSTWVEFEWEPVSKAGRGGKIRKIEITFKNGPQEEARKPAGFGEPWENELLNAKLSPISIIQMREWVEIRRQSYGEYIDKEFVWTNSYIHHSIEGARQEYRSKTKNAARMEKAGLPEDTHMVQDHPSWIFNGLIKGQWYEYASKQEMLMSDF